MAIIYSMHYEYTSHKHYILISYNYIYIIYIHYIYAGFVSKVMLFRNEDFETAMRDQSLARTNTYTKTKDYIIKLVDAVDGDEGGVGTTGHKSDPYPSIETLLCDIHDNPEYASSILSTENTLATTNSSTVYDKKTKAKYAQMARSIKLSAFVS